MKVEELLDLIRTRRNTKNFRSEPLKDEEVEKILEAARWSPSSGNAQPWELILIRDPETKRKIAEIHARAISGSGKVEKLPDRYLDPPVLIALCLDSGVKEKFPDLFAKDFLLAASLGTLMENMWLTATSMNIGMGTGSQPLSAQEELKDLLGVPENMWIPEIVQLGKKKSDAPEPARKEIENIVHLEKLQQ